MQSEEAPIEVMIFNSAISAGQIVADNVSSFDYNGLMTALWLGIAGLLIFRIVTGIIKTVLIISKGLLHSDKFPKLVLSESDHPPFSFWPYAVIPRKLFDSGDAKEIVAHENAHLRQGHTFDLIISELYVSIFWFNPAAWLIREAIKTNHEYLADHDLTYRSVNIKDYQYRLLNITEETESLQLAHSFNSLIKNRIIMINKKPTRTYATWKNLLILPAVALIFAAFSFKVANETNNNTMTTSEAVSTIPSNSEANPAGILTDIATEKPQGNQISIGVHNKADTLKKSTLSFVPGIGQVYVQVEQMPQFPGGEKELMKFISNNIKYPQKAKEMGIQGTVIASFIVNDKGKVVNAKIARGVGSGCDEEALRVINSMPDWTPGKQKGKEVNVSYVLPIKFVLGPGNSKPDNSSMKAAGNWIPKNPPAPPINQGVLKKINVDSLLLALQNIEDPNQPVILIDGRVSKKNEIKPEDIYSISVLKNESSTKFYGEKAKNGVILITSKQEEQRQTIDGVQAFVVVEQMPQFPGGEDEMRKYIKENIKYPEEAKRNKVSGTVIANFIIDKEGKIRNARIMRGIDKSLNDEALRVINQMPNWLPGKQGGKPVPVTYTIPVKFTLNASSQKIGNIKWLNNSVFSAAELDKAFGLKKGDEYTKENTAKRIIQDEDAVLNLYLNKGYLFANIKTAEIPVSEQIVDLTFTVFEGARGKFDKVSIKGNHNVQTEEILNKLTFKSGDWFSKKEIVQSVKALSMMDKINPESIKPSITPVFPSDKSNDNKLVSVNIEFELAEK